MKKSFLYEYKADRHDSISLEFADDRSERLNAYRCETTGEVVINANSIALLSMAKILIKMAQGDYSSSFHLHLREDFDDAKPQVIRIQLLKDSL
jgi:hypothetical protein